MLIRHCLIKFIEKQLLKVRENPRHTQRFYVLAFCVNRPCAKTNNRVRFFFSFFFANLNKWRQVTKTPSNSISCRKKENKIIHTILCATLLCWLKPFRCWEIFWVGWAIRILHRNARQTNLEIDKWSYT